MNDNKIKSNENYLKFLNNLYKENKKQNFCYIDLSLIKQFKLNHHVTLALLQLNIIKKKFGERSGNCTYEWIGKMPNYLMVYEIKQVMSNHVKNTSTYKHKIPKNKVKVKCDKLTLIKAIDAIQIAIKNNININNIPIFVENYCLNQ